MMAYLTSPSVLACAQAQDTLGRLCEDDNVGTIIDRLPGPSMPGFNGELPPLYNQAQQVVQTGTRVSPAETAALLAVHNANAKANTDRWETLVCSLRPVKGKTIEGILFRNEIPFWYNCND